jgi:hypothetical protein
VCAGMAGSCGARNDARFCNEKALDGTAQCSDIVFGGRPWRSADIDIKGWVGHCIARQVSGFVSQIRRTVLLLCIFGSKSAYSPMRLTQSAHR